MARPINRLSARSVATAKQGYHADGGGLYLQVSPSLTRSWVFRYKRLKQPQREMGLGSAAVVTLQEAREAALQARRVLASGLDPIDERRRAVVTTERTWGQAVDDYIEAHKAGWKNDAQAHQWEQSLADHGLDRSMRVADVGTQTVLDCLRPLWKPKDKGGRVETATRLRGRIERIWDAERVAGNVAGENPARWKGHLAALLPKRSKIGKAVHHAAMPYAQVGSVMAALRPRPSRSAKALRFTILTAARTEETVGADWPEFDLAAKVWTIPGERMKAGEQHQVPLSAEAVEILRSLPAGAPPFALSENAMLRLLQQPKHLGLPYTVHGFRSSFSDWAHETTEFPNYVIEMALAHKIKNAAEAAYRRGALMAKRRELMQAWADYLA
ncbi:tyrosine-type recombinase/integrase [Devosia sp.]|uniref:tyrosine-type recombinase/integrase n=1 Tax=Devosia sp. TaxID=1871048 RepID=UPI002FC98931